jgi:hypothetical protein
MGWVFGLVYDRCRSAQPVASAISITLTQLPYKIGTNTKCTAIQTFSKFLLFGYKIKNDIPQHTPSPHTHHIPDETNHCFLRGPLSMTA